MHKAAIGFLPLRVSEQVSAKRSRSESPVLVAPGFRRFGNVASKIPNNLSQNKGVNDSLGTRFDDRNTLVVYTSTRPVVSAHEFSTPLEKARRIIPVKNKFLLQVIPASNATDRASRRSQKAKVTHLSTGNPRASRESWACQFTDHPYARAINL
ncbi:hypothetical protein [Sphingobium ummariense]